MSLKRRRERDKPKSGPDALYNPNKRVLLSYASDDEGEEVDDPTQRPSTMSIDEQPAAGENAKLGTERALETNEEQDLPEDEDQQDLEEKDEDLGQIQQSKPSKKWLGENRVRRNEKCNQYPQLGLVSFQWDEEDEDEEYDSTTEEAMAYLRAVRNERQGLPEIMTAPTQDQDAMASMPEVSETGEDAVEYDAARQGLWASATPPTTQEVDDRTPQKVYTRNITERFLDQRRQLRLPPTADALADLDDSYPISFPQGNNKAVAEWYRLLSSKAPRLAQLQSLEQQTVFDLLDLLQARILAPGKIIEKHVSNWLWSLLARLDHVGNMTNDQVYPLRELGKRAVFLQYSHTSPEVAAQLEALDRSGSSRMNEDEIPLEDFDDVEETSKQPDPGPSQENQTGTASHSNAMENTLATLDVILIVVGEIYGQRDLLEFRTLWKAAEIEEA